MNNIDQVDLSQDTFLDIGANVGLWSKAFRDKWPKAQFTLIEANKSCESYLKESKFEYYIEVLGDKEKEVDFYMTKENDVCTGNSIYRDISEHYSDDKIIIEKRKVVTLDSLFPQRRFSIIKMDTQGSELDIINGGEEIIRSANIVMIEVSIVKCNEGSPLKEDIDYKMKDLGFVYGMISENHTYHRHDHPTIKFGDIIQQDIVYYR